MNHQEHVQLLERGVPGSGGVWADFGSGTGAFTLALAALFAPGGTIHSVDRNSGALHRQELQLRTRFPRVTLHTYVADYTQPLSLPPLDGIVMANALHFQRQKRAVVQLLRSYLRPEGRFILIEYDTDRGNRWVPHPLSYESWEQLACDCGFRSTKRLATRPSSFLGRFYSALSINP